jgi:carbon-monoxide dehydrogenase small subunit
MKIVFILNGKLINLNVSPNKSLLRVLREDCGVTSVKEGCGRGECGTCTVLLDGRAVTSCMVAVGQVRNGEVETVEGLQAAGKITHIQQAFMEATAVQCGFCTPGLVITAYSILKENPAPTRDEIRKAISGNICRCTGYTKIIDAIELAARTIIDDRIHNT